MKELSEFPNSTLRYTFQEGFKILHSEEEVLLIWMPKDQTRDLPLVYVFPSVIQITAQLAFKNTAVL